MAFSAWFSVEADIFAVIARELRNALTSVAPTDTECTS